jgi:DNA-binding winged helix-turn-helix (wHTH) protein
MSAELYDFGDFRLDVTNRRLERQGTVVELNSRSFDVLVLLVRQRGSLIPKQRFIEDVWSGVPVTDEALIDPNWSATRRPVSLPMLILDLKNQPFTSAGRLAS